jgi:hypothetical protein
MLALEQIWRLATSSQGVLEPWHPLIACRRGLALRRIDLI